MCAKGSKRKTANESKEGALSPTQAQLLARLLERLDWKTEDFHREFLLAAQRLNKPGIDIARLRRITTVRGVREPLGRGRRSILAETFRLTLTAFDRMLESGGVEPTARQILGILDGERTWVESGANTGPELMAKQIEDEQKRIEIEQKRIAESQKQIEEAQRELSRKIAKYRVAIGLESPTSTIKDLSKTAELARATRAPK